MPSDLWQSSHGWNVQHTQDEFGQGATPGLGGARTARTCLLMCSITDRGSVTSGRVSPGFWCISVRNLRQRAWTYLGRPDALPVFTCQYMPP